MVSSTVKTATRLLDDHAPGHAPASNAGRDDAHDRREGLAC